MLAWQGRAGVPAALLLDGEIAGVLPVQVSEVLVEERAIVLPGHRAQDVTALAVQAGHVRRRKGAAIGNHEQVGDGRQILLQQLELLLDGWMAVVVAVEEVAEHGHGAAFIYDSREAGLNELDVAGAVAIGDVGRGKVSRGRIRRQRQVRHAPSQRSTRRQGAENGTRARWSVADTRQLFTLKTLLCLSAPDLSNTFQAPTFLPSW